MEVSKSKHIIYGCMGLGGSWDNSPYNAEHIITARKAIHAALELGITSFDHADIYNLGKAEKVFGVILQENPGLRDLIKIQTKAGIVLANGKGYNTYNSSRDYFLTQINKSLKNLNTDYLDTFIIHRPDPLMDVEEVAETFDYLKSEGLVRRFGVSNMSLKQIELLQYYCDMPISANQIQFSLRHASLIDEGITFNMKGSDQNAVGDLLPFSKLHNLELQAWGALDNGYYLSDKGNPDDLRVKKILQQLSLKYNSNPTAILLAWIFKLPYAIKPIIGSTNPERIALATKAVNLDISREDWYELFITARDKTIP